jgi:hypothetical protein
MYEAEALMRRKERERYLRKRRCIHIYIYIYTLCPRGSVKILHGVLESMNPLNL